MEFTTTNFKHYTIDAGDVEKLIDMWKFFNKKDEPYPLTNGKVFLNSKNPEVGVYELMLNLVYPVFVQMPSVDRWYRTSLQLRMDSPVGSLYKSFIKKHRTELEEVKSEDFTEETPKKTRKKKI